MDNSVPYLAMGNSAARQLLSCASHMPGPRKRGVVGPRPNPTLSLKFLLHNFRPEFERN